jgi:DNA-directed RNA polymerase specialized sigma24 family protein
LGVCGDDAGVEAVRRSQLALPKPGPADQRLHIAILAAEDRGTRVRATLAVLTTEQAEGVRPAYFDDRPQADIKRVLGIPLGTVESRLRLAMSRLRGLMEGDQ